MLAQSHLLGSASPFVIANVHWKGAKVGATESLPMSTNPRWEGGNANEFKVDVDRRDGDDRYEGSGGKDGVKVVLLHIHKRGVGNFLGEAAVSAESISRLVRGERVTFQLPLEKSASSNMTMRHVQGTITISVQLG